MYLHKKINENLLRINRLYGFWTRIYAFPPPNNGNSTLCVTTKCTEISPHPTPSPSQSDYLPGREEHQDFSSYSRLPIAEAKFQVSVVRGEHPFFFFHLAPICGLEALSREWHCRECEDIIPTCPGLWGAGFTSSNKPRNLALLLFPTLITQLLKGGCHSERSTAIALNPNSTAMPRVVGVRGTYCRREGSKAFSKKLPSFATEDGDFQA